MQKFLLVIATLFLVTFVWANDDFYNRIVAGQVDQFKAEANNSLAQSATGLAGDNMITDGQARFREQKAQTQGNDFYNRVLLAQVDGYSVGNDALAPSSPGLAGNNMITDEQASFNAKGGQGDFYNRVLSAHVDRYGVDNNAIAPSALEFAEPQIPSAGDLPGSMAANIGLGRQSDWYSQTVAVQAELNRRCMKAETARKF